jgi:hypothetical protein
MTMVERVARAILRAELEREAARLLAEGRTGDANALFTAAISGSGRHWKSRLDEARSAIAAMREPTEAMKLAGYSIIDPHEDGPREHHIDLAWQLMIDAALREETT